ncbi:hypothetical protein [Parvibaculum sp.]|uniref:hypothetical protein n=1 Tax=Parvibaculum sp. TaxID=2024848 RepID=UPI00320ED342
MITRNGRIRTPAFAIPKPKFAVSAVQVAPFLEHISDADFAEAIGAPLPAPNISSLSINPAGQS